MSRGVQSIVGVALIAVGAKSGQNWLIATGASMLASGLLTEDPPEGAKRVPRGSSGRQVVRAPSTPYRWPVGHHRTGGSLEWQRVDGKRLRQVISFGEGPIYAIEKIWRDGNIVQWQMGDEDGNPLTGEPTNLLQRNRVIVPAGTDRNKYGPRGFRIRFFPFGLDENIDPFDFETGYSSHQRLDGMAFVAIECYQEDYGNNLDDRAWTQPPQWSFQVRGIDLPTILPVPDDGSIPQSIDWVNMVGVGSKLWLIERAANRTGEGDAGLWPHARIWIYDPDLDELEMFSHGFIPADTAFGVDGDGEPLAAGRVIQNLRTCYRIQVNEGGQFELHFNRSGIPRTPGNVPSIGIGSRRLAAQAYAVVGGEYFIQEINVDSLGGENNNNILSDDPTADPPVVEVRTPLTGYVLARGMAVLNGAIYMVERVTHNLVTFDPATKAFARVGADGALGAPGAGSSWAGIAAAGGRLYVLQSGGDGPALFEVDVDTGTKSAVTGLQRIIGAAWGRNTADAARFFFRKRMGWPSDIPDYAAYVAARTLCANSQVTLSLPDTYDTNNYPRDVTLYTADGEFRSGDDPIEIMKELGFAMAGGFSEKDGRVFMRPGPLPGTERPKTFSIGPEDIADYGMFRASGAIEDKANSVTFGLDQSAAHDYTEFRSPMIRDTAAIEKDGGASEIDIGTRVFVSSPTVGIVLARIYLLQQRAQRTMAPVLLPGVNRRNKNHQPYDRGDVRLPDYGIDAIDMEIYETRPNSDDTVGTILREAPAGIHSLPGKDFFPDELPEYTADDEPEGAAGDGAAGAQMMAPSGWVSSLATAPSGAGGASDQGGGASGQQAPPATPPDARKGEVQLASLAAVVDLLGRVIVPIPVVTAEADDKSVTYSWSAGAGTAGAHDHADSFEYQTRDGSGAWSASVSTDATTQTRTGLAANSTVHFRVRAVVAMSDTITYRSDWSDVVTSSTGFGAPAAAVASDITTHSATFTWSAIPAAVSYSYRLLRGTSGSTTQVGITSTTETSVTISGLNSGSPYRFQVRATSDLTTTDWSAATTIYAIINAPTGAGSSNVTSSGFRVTWDIPFAPLFNTLGIRGQVQVREGNAVWDTYPVRDALPGTAGYYDVTGLKSTTEYGARIRFSLSRGTQPAYLTAWTEEIRETTAA